MAYPPFAYMEPAIAQGESGGDWNALYNFQNRAGGLFGDVNVSDMTINEVLDFQRTGSPYATYVTDILGYKSTPVGRYQIVGDTLEWAKGKLGLTGEEKFDPATQRQIAEYIYNTQGPSAWEALKGTQMADQMIPQPMAPQQAAGYQPFSTENLPRNQRILLGLSALQDAAASLRGKQTSFFSEALGGLEQQHRYGQELAFRQGQEQRLIDENRQQRELTAMTEIRRLMAERQKALDYGYPTDAIDAQIAAYQSSLSAMGSAFGQPTPAAQPAAGGLEPAAGGVEPAPQALNVTTASEAVYNRNTSDADLDAAIQFLSRRAPTDPNVQGVLRDAIDERNRRATAAEAAGVTEGRAAKFTEYGSQVADFLIQGYDQDGAPIFNPAVAGRGGRLLSSWLQTKEYQGYVGALQNIKNNLTMDKLREAKAAGLTGSISNADLEAIARAASTLDVNDPIGTFNALLNLEREYGINLGLGSRRGGGGTANGLIFEEVTE